MLFVFICVVQLYCVLHSWAAGIAKAGSRNAVIFRTKCVGWAIEGRFVFAAGAAGFGPGFIRFISGVSTCFVFVCVLQFFSVLGIVGCRTHWNSCVQDQDV